MELVKQKSSEFRFNSLNQRYGFITPPHEDNYIYERINLSDGSS